MITLTLTFLLIPLQAFSAPLEQSDSGDQVASTDSNPSDPSTTTTDPNLAAAENLPPADAATDAESSDDQAASQEPSCDPSTLPAGSSDPSLADMLTTIAGLPPSGVGPTEAVLPIGALAPTAASLLVVTNEDELRTAINMATEATTITFGNDIILSSTLTIPAGKTITLQGSLALAANGAFPTITINAGADLTLDGITVTHSSGSGLGVLNNGSLALVSGSITGNAGMDGGGVDNAGTMTMSGGVISQNSASNGGGGIKIMGNGVLTMTGGVICQNTDVGSTTSGGGVMLGSSNARFNFIGGSITNNTANYTGGGVAIYGGVMTMSGGEITNNLATLGSSASSGFGGGVSVMTGSLIMTGGSISNNTANFGGGVFVYINCTFDMSGGVISDNATTLATHGGGGVYSYGSFNLSGNAQILHNTSPFGGGIYLLYGAFTMSDNALIANNYSTSGNGGGLYLDAANGVTATINGGSFINNTAAMNGGAIWLSRTITPSGTTTPVNILNRLKVAAGVYFSQNQAIYAYELAPEDVAIYQAQIGNNGQDVTWTIPFTQGYNNFDIGYVYGTRIQYYTVSFDGNGGTVLPADLSRYVRSGDSLGANLPAAPLRDHQHFVGWNSAADGSGSEFTEATMVQSNLLVYAQWQENLYHVTVLDSYAVASGSGDYHFADTVSIQAGQCAGYNFAGWTVWSSNVSLSDSSVELADFVMPDADVVVQALWRAIPTYTVQFVDHDDTILSVQQVESDGSAVAPVSPSRAGYQFSGWDSDFSHVQSDLTVRAEYLKLPGEEPQVPSDPPVNPPRNPRIIPTITARPPATNPAPTTPAQTEVAAESTPTAAASSTNTAASTAVATPEREAMPTWALVNLLLAALGLLLALITILIKVLRRQTGSDQEATPLTTVEPMPAAAAEQNIQLETNPLVRSVESLTTPAAEQARRPKSRIAPLLLLVASAICGIGVFLWTENLNNPMAWVDVWTIVQAILALAVVVLMVATLRKGKTEEDSEETED